MEIAQPMNIQHLLPVAAVFLIAANPVTAQTVYKSIDAQGRVTYSSKPPPVETPKTVERVPIAPGPTPQQQQEATHRATELQATTNSTLKQRKEQENEGSSTASDAEKALLKAGGVLEEAGIKGNDWQPIVEEGRVLDRNYRDGGGNAERGARNPGNTERKSR